MLPQGRGFKSVGFIASSCAFALSAFLTGAALAQEGEGEGTTDFVQAIKTTNFETTISIAAEALMEPELGVQLVRESVGTARKLAQSADEDAVGEPEYFRQYLSSETWDVTYESPAYLSVLGTQWLYTGGAHGNSVFASVIWQRDTGGVGAGSGVGEATRAQAAGREVSIASFFTNGEVSSAPVWAALSAVLHAQWEKEWQERVGEPFSPDDQSWRDSAAEALTLKADGRHVVTLLPSTQTGVAGGLTFHYAPYELGPYAMGTFSLNVPQAVFREYLKPTATGLFGGDVPESVTWVQEQ